MNAVLNIKIYHIYFMIFLKNRINLKASSDVYLKKLRFVYHLKHLVSDRLISI